MKTIFGVFESLVRFLVLKPIWGKQYQEMKYHQPGPMV